MQRRDGLWGRSSPVVIGTAEVDYCSRAEPEEEGPTKGELSHGMQ